MWWLVQNKCYTKHWKKFINTVTNVYIGEISSLVAFSSSFFLSKEIRGKKRTSEDSSLHRPTISPDEFQGIFATVRRM